MEPGLSDLSSKLQQWVAPHNTGKKNHIDSPYDQEVSCLESQVHEIGKQLGVMQNSQGDKVTLFRGITELRKDVKMLSDTIWQIGLHAHTLNNTEDLKNARNLADEIHENIKDVESAVNKIFNDLPGDSDPNIALSFTVAKKQTTVCMIDANKECRSMKDYLSQKNIERSKAPSKAHTIFARFANKENLLGRILRGFQNWLNPNSKTKPLVEANKLREILSDYSKADTEEKLSRINDELLELKYEFSGKNPNYYDLTDLASKFETLVEEKRLLISSLRWAKTKDQRINLEKQIDSINDKVQLVESVLNKLLNDAKNDPLGGR